MENKEYIDRLAKVEVEEVDWQDMCGGYETD